MALDITLAGLWREVQAAKEANRKRLSSQPAMVRAYHSVFHKGNVESDDFDPENHYFERVSTMLPKMAYDRPVVLTRSKLPGIEDAEAEALKHGLNRWIVDTQFETLAQESALHMLMGFGCLLLRRKPSIYALSDDGARADWPYLEMVSPEDSFRDPASKTGLRRCRYFGHSRVVDHDDFLKQARGSDEKWNIEAIKNLDDDGDLEDRIETDDTPERKTVTIYYMWVRDYEGPDHPGSDQGFNGTWFTFGRQGGGTEGTKAFLKPPEPAYVPHGGPYYFLEEFPVIGDPWGLSSLVAVQGQIRMHNRASKAISDSNDRYAKMIAVDSADKGFARRVQRAKQDGILKVTGLDKAKLVQFEIGGATPAMHESRMFSKELVDRMLGIDDQQRGIVNPGGTATQAAIANDAASGRADWVVRRFRAQMTEALRGVASMMWRDEKVKIPMGSVPATFQNKETGEITQGMQGIEFQGGSDRKFEDVEIEISAMSMGRVSPEQRQARLTGFNAELLQVLPVMPTLPFWNWKRWVRDMGEVWGIDDADEYLSEEVLAQLAQLAFQDPGQTAQPRLSSMVGQPTQGPVSARSGPSGPQSPPLQGGLRGNQTGSQAGGQAQAAGGAPQLQGALGA